VELKIIEGGTNDRELEEGIVEGEAKYHGRRHKISKSWNLYQKVELIDWKVVTRTYRS
jgi:hypothetical protein